MENNVKDYGFEGDIVAVTKMKPIVNFTMTKDLTAEALHRQSAVDNSFEDFLKAELEKRNLPITKDNVKYVYTQIQTKAKKLYKDRVVRRSTESIADSFMGYMQTQNVEKAPKLLAAPKTVSSNRVSAVPAKFRHTGTVMSTTESKDYTIIDMDNSEIPSEVHVPHVQVHQLEKIDLHPITSRNYPILLRSDAWNVIAHKFESCKVLNCPYMGFKPKHTGVGPLIENNQFFGACGLAQDSEIFKQKCPQEIEMSSVEKGLYQTVVGDVGDEAAKKVVYKLRAAISKMTSEKSKELDPPKVSG